MVQLLASANLTFPFFCPGLATAHHAHAHFEFSRALSNDVAGIGLTIGCVVDSARPFVIRDGFHPAEYIDANDRALSNERLAFLSSRTFAPPA
jgi:hypothetical protein